MSALRLWNGYHKNAGLYARNNRIRDIEVILSNGRSRVETLPDSSGPQTIQIDGNPVVEWVQLKIGSVYRGTKHRDTAITELRVFTSTP